MKISSKNNFKIKAVKKFSVQFGSGLLLWLFAMSAQASTTSQYPWAETLKKIFDSLRGPVAYSIAGIAIVTSSLVMAFSDLQGGAKRLVQAAVGISIAFGVTTILTSFFTFSAAVVGH